MVEIMRERVEGYKSCAKDRTRKRNQKMPCNRLSPFVDEWRYEALRKTVLVHSLSHSPPYLTKISRHSIPHSQPFVAKIKRPPPLVRLSPEATIPVRGSTGLLSSPQDFFDIYTQLHKYTHANFALFAICFQQSLLTPTRCRQERQATTCRAPRPWWCRRTARPSLPPTSPSRSRKVGLAIVFRPFLTFTFTLIGILIDILIIEWPPYASYHLTPARHPRDLRPHRTAFGPRLEESYRHRCRYTPSAPCQFTPLLQGSPYQILSLSISFAFRYFSVLNCPLMC
jgi:hypothetical protein